MGQREAIALLFLLVLMLSMGDTFRVAGAGLIWRYRGEMTFNGTSDKVEVADSESFYTPDGLTVDVWVKPSLMATNDMYPVVTQYVDGDAAQSSIRLSVYNSNIDWALYSAAAGRGGFSDATTAD